MKVKVGNKFIDSNDEPTMIIFTPEEKELLSNTMIPTKFCSFPENYDRDAIKIFMEGDKNNE